MDVDSPSVTYRLADADDAAGIADLYARSWRSAYRGHLPDDFLDHEVVEERARVWAERFQDRTGTLTVVAEAGPQIMGFAHSLVDDDPQWGTLLDNLHVEPVATRSGIGRQLMVESARCLPAVARSTRFHLWVLEANQPARRFYSAMGGKAADSGISTDGGGSAPIVRYVWEHLTDIGLAAH